MKQAIHRWVNTILTSALFGLLLTGGVFAHKMYDELKEDKGNLSEMAQIVSDEGFKECVYKDSRKFDTIGFGHLIKSGEKFKCINAQRAMQMLQEDYFSASASVEINYPWATGEVKLVLTNMTYQLGENGVKKFKKTLLYLKNENYAMAAMEMLNSSWHKQTKNRSMRLAIRILSLEG